MVEQLRRFLLICPLLRMGDEMVPRVYVDYLPEIPVAYDISFIPTTPWIRRYVDGGGVRQLTFVFRSIETYEGRDIETNIANVEFFNAFTEWLENTPPEIPGWIKVEALTNGYFFDVAEGQTKASYQIQCRIIYTV